MNCPRVETVLLLPGKVACPLFYTVIDYVKKKMAKIRAKFCNLLTKEVNKNSKY